GIAAPAGIVPAPQPAMTEPKTQAQPHGPSTCIDGMETEPDYDDLDPTPVSDTVDGGCLTSPQPIST
ncbi:MAG TPA: hypothetical protein VHC39_01210, partial [Rhizomicrobium sp.]|nr:hypothetical protein [Rhizomicrobium sp.]